MKKPKLTDARLVRIYKTDDDLVTKLMRYLDKLEYPNMLEKQDILRMAIHEGLPSVIKRIKG